MSRNPADPSRTGSSATGYRRGAILVGGLAIVVLVAGTAMNWPTALSVQAELARLYGKGRAHITALRVNRSGWACGTYALPPQTAPWKFVESRSVLWAQGTPETWVRPGSRRQGEERWSDCMTLNRRGRGLKFDTVNDWITGKLLGVFG